MVDFLFGSENDVREPKIISAGILLLVCLHFLSSILVVAELEFLFSSEIYMLHAAMCVNEALISE